MSPDPKMLFSASHEAPPAREAKSVFLMLSISIRKLSKVCKNHYMFVHGLVLS